MVPFVLAILQQSYLVEQILPQYGCNPPDSSTNHSRNATLSPDERCARRR